MHVGLRVILLTSTLVSAHMTLLPALASADPAGVTFVVQGPHEFEVMDGFDEAQLMVVVFNGSPVQRTVGLQVTQLSADEGQLTVLVPAAQTIAAAATYTFELRVSLDGVAPARYSGDLVATSTDGTLARDAVLLDVPSPEGTETAVAPDALRSPLPEEVPMAAVLMLPSPFATALDGIRGTWRTSPQPISIPVSSPLAGQFEGAVLVSSGGARATVDAAAGSDVPAIEVNGIEVAGLYQGKLSFGDSGTTTLKLSVRDLVIWPFLVLFSGLLVVSWLDGQLSRTIPRARLRLRLQAIKEEVVKHQDLADPSKGANPPYRVWSPRGDDWVDKGSGALAIAAEEALRAFDEQPDAAKAVDEWKSTGSKFGEILKLESGLRQLTTMAESVRQRLSKLKDVAGARWGRLGDQPVVADANRVLRGRELSAREELTDALDDIKGVDELADEFTTVLDTVSRWWRTQSDTTKKRAIAKILDRLCDSGVATVEELQMLKGEALKHAAEVDDEPRFAAPSARFGEPAPVKVADLTQALDRRETIAGRATFVLVVLSGLVAVYLSNPTFGTWADYVGAFLWGSVVGGAITLARRLPFLTAA